MNPKIKEALACEYKKDTESERICTFVANFIKKYGYLANSGDCVHLTIYFPEWNSFILGIPKSTSIRHKFTSHYNTALIVKILQMEGAEIKHIGNEMFALTFKKP